MVQATGRERHGFFISPALSVFSQQLIYTCREHEPLPFFYQFSHGGGEVRGERDESGLEPSDFHPE
jgi:hypothetical protein